LNHILPEHVECKHVTYGLAVTLTSRAVVTAKHGMLVMTAEMARCAFERRSGLKTFASFRKEHAFVPMLLIYVTVHFCDSKENLSCSDEHVRNSR
jgi:hypothetical protein